MGGAGHVVPAPKGSGTMGIVMPIYTIGIVVFFMYTVMKVVPQIVCSMIYLVTHHSESVFINKLWVIECTHWAPSYAVLVFENIKGKAGHIWTH